MPMYFLRILAEIANLPVVVGLYGAGAALLAWMLVPSQIPVKASSSSKGNSNC